MGAARNPLVVIFGDYLSETKWLELKNYVDSGTNSFRPMPKDFPLRWEQKYSIEYSKKYFTNKLISDQKLDKLMSGEDEEEDILPADALGFYKDMNSPPYITEILYEIFELCKGDIKKLWGVDVYYEGIHAISAMPDGVSMGSHADGYLIGNEKQAEFSSIYYINDDFDGGEIVFENIGMKFKPIKNSLIIFSNSSSEKMIHSVGTVFGGTRYMSQCFFTAQ